MYAHFSHARTETPETAVGEDQRDSETAEGNQCWWVVTGMGWVSGDRQWVLGSSRAAIAACLAALTPALAALYLDNQNAPKIGICGYMTLHA
jgi:hypothetical protein